MAVGGLHDLLARIRHPDHGHAGVRRRQASISDPESSNMHRDATRVLGTLLHLPLLRVAGRVQEGSGEAGAHQRHAGSKGLRDGHEDDDY